MPKEIFNREWEFLARDLLLSFEEIERVTAVFARLGVEKLRITGGEPLMRRGIADLVGGLSGIEGIGDVALTTNGSLLERRAAELAEAGLSRVSVSLDSLDDETFMAMNDVGYPATKVLAGIDAAAAAGLTPVKVNVVVKRGVNDKDVLPMAEHFRNTGHVVRFIEYMDVGATNGWRLDDVVPAAEIIESINAVHPLEPVDPHYPGEVAQRYLYKDGSGEVGVISSVSQPFCGTCSRARISAEGKLYTCLFATAGTDLRGPLRAGYTDEQLESLIRGVWTVRGDRYSEVRSEATLNLPKVEMSYIGG
jgi:cyclic pyranopterin phosphate synthase